MLGRHTIKRVNSTKFLGVILDENVNWSTHINFVSNKISKLLGIMYRAKPFLDQNSLKLVYNAFLNPYLTYANIAWGSTCKGKLHPLLVKQKHAVRIIANLHRLSHSEPWFKNLQILSIYQINILQHLNFMFKLRTNKIPAVLSCQFSSRQHKYDTRNINNTYILPRYKTKTAQFSVTYRDPRIWNEYVNLLSRTKLPMAITKFKNLVKRTLLENPDNFNLFF